MNWEIRYSNSRKLPYFYNTATNESRWDPPTDVTESQIHAMPGAKQHLPAINRMAGVAPEVMQGGGVKVPSGSVRASHILAKHTGSRRPSSWREQVITRSPDEARNIIQNHINTLAALIATPDKLAAKFAEIASSESDCSSAKKGGDLGVFGRGMMQGPFEAATYALQPGEISKIVETDSGVHVILRTA